MGFRAGWLRHFKVALSSAGGAAVIFGLFELLQKQPVQGFKLLGEWGPWPVLAMVGLVLVAPFLVGLQDTVRTAFGAIVSNFQLQTVASTKTADALTRLADQGGRQAEEIRRLAIFNAQEFPGIYSRFDKQDEVLQDLSSLVKVLVTRGRDDH